MRRLHPLHRFPNRLIKRYNPAMPTPLTAPFRALFMPALVIAALTAAAALTSAPANAQGGVFYRYCSDARAAGVAPIRRGQPGYAPHLDRDGDGIACESYRGNRTASPRSARRRIRR